MSDHRGSGSPCPCGAGPVLGECCGPYVVDGLPAPTAEALMRSRYTAYVLGAADHLFRTWHPRTRPADPVLSEDTEWVGLDIAEVVAGGVDDDSGVVEFVARWREHGQRGELRERSRFARRAGRWVYVDGAPAEGRRS